MKSKFILCLLPLLAGATLHAQSITATGDVTPVLNPNPSPSWDAGSDPVILGAGSGDSGTLTIDGGTLTTADEFRIGDSGDGTLFFNGGTISDTTANIARSTGSTGTVTMSGGTWNNSATFVVGNGGTGTFTQTGGTVNSTNNSWVGKNSGGVATATISGGTWNTNGYLYIADSGSTGTLTLIGDGHVGVSGDGVNTGIVYTGTRGTLNFGSYDLTNPTTAGTLSVARIVMLGTINFNQSNDFTISTVIDGSGTIEQRGTGTTTYTADNTTGLGTLMSGTIHLMVSQGSFVVAGNFDLQAYSGTTDVNGGSLTVRTGGTLTDKQGSIGSSAGSVGAAVVDGGSWANNAELRVGDLGTGSLDFKSGAIYDTYANIARDPGSTGTVTMSGGTWNNWSALVVGNAGTGTFTQTGGTVNAPEGDIGFRSGGVGVLNLLGGGTITLNNGVGTLNVAGAAGSTGTLNFGAYDLAHATAAGVLNAASIVLGPGTGTVNFNQNNAYTLAAVISGHGTVNQRGTGVTTLAGANTYTGATNITGGTLKLASGATLANTETITIASGATFDVSDVADGFTLGAAQTLAGDGTVLGDATIAGTLAPGDSSAGLLTFVGDLALGSTATVLIDLGDTNDAIAVGGNLTYGGTLTVSLIDGFTPTDGQQFQLFSVTGTGISSGDFTSVSVTAPGWAGSFNSATGQLTLTAVPEPATCAAFAALAGLVAAIALRRRRTAA